MKLLFLVPDVYDEESKTTIQERRCDSAMWKLVVTRSSLIRYRFVRLGLGERVTSSRDPKLITPFSFGTGMERSIGGD